MMTFSRDDDAFFPYTPCDYLFAGAADREGRMCMFKSPRMFKGASYMYTDSIVPSSVNGRV